VYILLYLTHSVKISDDWSERAKIGEFEGENFCPRAASEALPPCSFRTEPSRKIALSFFDFARADFFLKGKAIFLQGSAARAVRRRGGAI